MNKRLLSSIVIVVGFLVFAFFQGTHSSNHQAKIPKVGILQLVTHPALDEIHQGVVAGLKQEGYVNGKTVKIDYQNAQANQANLKTMAQNFINQGDNLTVGIATPAVLSLAKAANGQSPVILAGITDPVGAKLVKSIDKPGANITGTSGDSPLTEHLDVIQKVAPQAKTLGIIYTSSDHGGTYHAQKTEKLAQEKGLRVKMYTIASTNDMQQVAETMAGQVDVVYAPQDNGVASAMKTLINTTNQAKIPVIPATDTMVKDGGIATMSVSQFDIGYQAGLMAGQVLKGQNPATMPVRSVMKGSLVVNIKEAQMLGIELPANMVQEAQAHGEVIQ
ncbi:tryptophan ABC transporter substrate-binding protein [Convivina praedatoris]|uniref:ABC transporter substrate-binding protein n=1 Tax=Convivina praedatoris TaxID=2880963 RepID=A0ABM9D2Z6_9LACO|nr:tryptophan ABC transporter substrate-binding protein [Convivina sp. LMG 32447]CAH1855822.1 hypothetical protein R077815_01285 [Convivina sp. LMG 32447]CAH1856682.1 hypothetical protein LMG032447_01345 [Convivina sp. LMG 32447]CAH1856808.1 hypothetical protein R078138_01438 [Convivina sp. LMG 32447]